MKMKKPAKKASPNQEKKRKKLEKNRSRITSVHLEDQADSDYYIYGTSVIEDRAIFGSIDGLKPVVRRSLWASYELGLRFKSKADKAAKVVGHCFTDDTLVSTPEGDVLLVNLKVGDVVLSDIGNHKVTEAYVLPPSLTATLTLADGTRVTATLDQVFYTVDSQGNEQEVALRDLKKGMKIYRKAK